MQNFWTRLQEKYLLQIKETKKAKEQDLILFWKFMINATWKSKAEGYKMVTCGWICSFSHPFNGLFMNSYIFPLFEVSSSKMALLSKAIEHVAFCVCSTWIHNMIEFPHKMKYFNQKKRSQTQGNHIWTEMKAFLSICHGALSTSK